MSRFTVVLVAGLMVVGCVVALLPAQESSRRTASKFRATPEDASYTAESPPQAVALPALPPTQPESFEPPAGLPPLSAPTSKPSTEVPSSIQSPAEGLTPTSPPALAPVINAPRASQSQEMVAAPEVAAQTNAPSASAAPAGFPPASPPTDALAQEDASTRSVLKRSSPTVPESPPLSSLPRPSLRSPRSPCDRC